VTELAGFGEGRWWVQDLAASFPARLIPPEPTDVLDLCAAPGGKTMQLASSGHNVTAVDSSESRLGRLRENLDRTHLRAELVEADALRWTPQRKFSAILLDAPCSATGTFRRHPEVLYRVRKSFIDDAAQAQLRLLSRASDWVEPGGSIVYSVCSLEPEEGEQVVRGFLDGHPAFSVVASRTGELPESVSVAPEGWVRILPGLLEAEGGLDGFFMARLVRAA
jgi:16S rRNA (cytosine967-C5)-methyltransferase